MNGLTVMLIALVALACGYFGYARWLEKTWGIDPNRPTPAVENKSGDYAPANKWTVFAHQFTSITGAGPVTGPIIAAMFGWLPALLWMLIGGIFFGAVQDFTALYASVKNGGRSIGMIIEDYIGRTGRRLFLLFCWLFTLLVIAAFCDMVANTFNGFAKDGSQIMPNAAAGSISLLYMFVAVLFGLYLKKFRPTAGIQLVVGIVLMCLMLWVGIANPIYLDSVTWRYVVFAYLFAASVMPMWLLKQPRDYLSMFLLIGMIVCSKKQKTNPAMQPVAFVLFVVVVISAGLLLNEMNVFGTRDGLLENEMKFYASQGTKTGDYLKTTFPGKKVLLVADPGFEKNDNVKKLADALQAGYGGEVVTDTVQLPGNQADAPMPLYMMMKAADFDAMVDKHPDCGVIVTTVGLPQDANRLKFMKQSADKRPALFLMGLPSGPVPGIMAALQSGIITGLIISNPDAKYDVPAPSDPMKAFDIRYVLVTKENADQYKAHFSN